MNENNSLNISSVLNKFIFPLIETLQISVFWMSIGWLSGCGN
jgi:hypothetical protein